MKIHIVSETEFVMKATGVHTAFRDHVELLRGKNDIEVVVNNEGEGDVYHGHTYGLYYIWKGRKYKGRRVFTAHVTPDSVKGSLPLWWLFKPLVRLGLRIVYSYADVCIAISPMVEKSIIETGARTKVVRIFNPVNTQLWRRSDEKRKKGREMLGLSEDEFVVLGAGQLIGRKGVEDFIDISEAVPSARFVWAGGRPFGALSEGITRINEKIRKAGNNFQHPGSFDLEQMPYIYAAADLLIFPSFQENCPLTPIEAAACGMPVIFRDLEEYKTLYQKPYIFASDQQEFINLTNKMMTDREFYNEGLRISEELLGQFDMEVIRSKMMSLYSGLINNSQSSASPVIIAKEVSWGVY
jgi:1,2-diacylglycerol-3-alpha-glucose alpha-1,2-galactosyltransferase